MRDQIAQRMAEHVGLAWDQLPETPDMACGHGMPEGCRRYWRELADIADAYSRLSPGAASIVPDEITPEDIAWAERELPSS